MKNNKKIIIYSILIFFVLLFKSSANSDLNFLSLKNSEVNLRQGPSFDHPVKFIYALNTIVYFRIT